MISTNDPGDAIHDLIDADDLDLDAIDLYQPSDLDEDVDPGHRKSTEDPNRDLLHGYDKPSAIPSTPVDAVPMSTTLWELLTAQKTDDFCQAVFTAMGQAN